MPKGQKKANFKPTFDIALLLVKIILIKIGSIPFTLMHTIADIFTTAVGNRFQHRKRGRPKKLRLSTRFKIITGVSIFALFFITYTFFILTAAYELPTPTRLTSLNQPLTTQFYDRNGILLYKYYEGKNRTLVKLADIPKPLIQATIAVEDHNFYHHIGIDLMAILRALYHNIKNNTAEGASTITQQLIKNSLLTPEKSYSRKIREIILALWTEQIYSKDQILQMYFNEAPYGGATTGIAAAAETYFGKPVSQLNLAESAYLAGLPASPTQFLPYGSTAELAKIRQRQVLDRMVEEKYLTKSQADEVYLQELKLQPLASRIKAPHFVMYARDLLAAAYGSRMVSQGGLKVFTTLDLSIQEEVEAIIKEEIGKLTPLNVQNGAAIVADKNGQILAMVGSKDYHEPKFGNYNVTTALRQPGSSIKVITYAVAFKKGFSPGSTILDTPVTFNNGVNTYSPINYDGAFHGPISIRTALGSSYNVPAVKMLATIGVPEMIKTAHDLGITTLNETNRYGLSLTLGAGEVKMIDMISVYGTLANLGVKKYPTPFLKVTDSNNNVLEEFSAEGKQVLEPQVAYLITDILKDNKARTPAFGPSSLLYIPGYEVAVKTGTSDNKRDNWTFGYTPKFIVGVWVGNPDNSPMNPRLTSGVTGAAPIWNKIIYTLLARQPVGLTFERAAGITEGPVEGRKDLRFAGTIPKALTRVKKDGDKLVFSDAFSVYATPSAQANLKPPSL